MKLLIFLSLLFFAANVQCRTAIILNGTDAESEDAPYIVALYGNGRFGCSGALIAKNKVLTAAHCIVRGKKLTARVELKNRSSTDYPEFTFSHVSIHPDYVSMGTKDLAVITLENEVNLEEYPNVAFAKLQTEELTIGSELRVFGWGQQIGDMYGGSHTKPDILKKATLFVESLEKQNIISATSPYSIPCFNDDGGPLESSDGKLAAIVSHFRLSREESKCRAGIINDFVKVSDFVSWIKDQ